jgi:hypothetical protein
MLLFGTNDVRITSYTPFELGISNNPHSGFSIEIRQKYLHILQIPIMPISKTWHIRKGPQLTPMPEPYKRQINKKKATAYTPLHTCTGALLIVAALMSYYIIYPKYKAERHRAIFEKIEPSRVSI